MNVENIKQLYLEGKSSLTLAKEFGVSKKTILNYLHTLPNWTDIKQKSHKIFLAEKAKYRIYKGICLGCNKEFESNRKRNFCNINCYKRTWQKKYMAENREIINERKRKNRAAKEKKLTAKKQWELKFLNKVKQFHPRSADRVAKRILKRIDTAKNSMVTRSKKNNVGCTITIEELRNLVYSNYGNKCRYCDKILTIDNFVFDHKIPMSKNGSSSIENIQLICKTSNGMKGSLDENNFQLLLSWLKTIPAELSKDISIRLARGIH